jgi:hypothetical protein
LIYAYHFLILTLILYFSLVGSLDPHFENKQQNLINNLNCLMSDSLSATRTILELHPSHSFVEAYVKARVGV